MPGGGLAASCADAAVDLADDFRLLRQRSRERHAVGQHVVLLISASGIAQDAESDVADDTHRLDRLGAEH